MDYAMFIEGKTQFGSASGFEPLWMPEFLFGFQAALDGWAIRKGRAEIAADCGLGKSPMLLVWAENVVRYTNRPVLICTPLCVGPQMVREAEKFGIECKRSRNGSVPAKIVVTNYELLHLFSPSDFGGMVSDEAGILKNYDGKTRAAIIEFMRTLPYRLLCTATPAPNDYVELGNSAEALGEMGFQDMVTRFFKKETSKDHLGWGRTKYRMRGHAAKDFWRWVCSWMRACRKPSDLGFDDGPFILPELITREHEVKAGRLPKGKLFDLPAENMEEEREEARRSLPERCEKVAELVNHKDPAIAWCNLNDEGDLLAKLIPDAVQVSGSASDERKEEVFEAFVAGQIRVLVTKPKLGGFGMNWQHCSHQTFFPSHSFEQYYQCVRRSWRFGQKKPVTIDNVTTQGASGVQANRERKQKAADAMFANLVELMNDQLKIQRGTEFTKKATLPTWLAPRGTNGKAVAKR